MKNWSEQLLCSLKKASKRRVSIFINERLSVVSREGQLTENKVWVKTRAGQGEPS